MGSATRAITDRVTKQIVTIFSKTCNKYPYHPVYQRGLVRSALDAPSATYNPKSLCGQLRYRLCCAYAQADLDLRWPFLYLVWVFQCPDSL